MNLRNRMTKAHVNRNKKKRPSHRGSFPAARRGGSRRLLPTASYAGSARVTSYLPLFLIDSTRCVVALSPAASLTVNVTVTL